MEAGFTGVEYGNGGGTDAGVTSGRVGETVVAGKIAGGRGGMLSRGARGLGAIVGMPPVAVL